MEKKIDSVLEFAQEMRRLEPFKEYHIVKLIKGFMSLSKDVHTSWANLLEQAQAGRNLDKFEAYLIENLKQERIG